MMIAELGVSSFGQRTTISTHATLPRALALAFEEQYGSDRMICM